MWNNEIIYQIYMPSYGKKINEIYKLIPLFKKLKVTTLWFSPLFPDGGKDGGYDVTDFYDINKKYGNLFDFKKLIKKLHNNNIKIIIDIIPNHTSHKHPWFQQARDINSDKRDWYVWTTKEKKPNNWFSYFEDEPWTLDPKSNMYYYHHFYKEQPDLNYWNDNLRNEIKNIFYYWLDMGIDGFRMDAIGCIYHDKELKDNACKLRKSQINRPETITFMKELSDSIKKKYDNKILLGETEFLSNDDMTNITKCLDLSMNYNWSYINKMDGFKFYNQTLIWNNLCKKLNKQPLYYLYNHDYSRGRYGENENINIRKLLFVLLHSMPGYKIMYYGEELGMSDGLNSNYDLFGRDPYRSPYPWTKDFSIKNWIKKHPNSDKINLKNQLETKNSYLNFTFKILNLLYLTNTLKFNISYNKGLIIIKRNNLDIYINFEKKIQLKLNNIIYSNLYHNDTLEQFGFVIKLN